MRRQVRGLATVNRRNCAAWQALLPAIALVSAPLSTCQQWRPHFLAALTVTVYRCATTLLGSNFRAVVTAIAKQQNSPGGQGCAGGAEPHGAEPHALSLLCSPSHPPHTPPRGRFCFFCFSDWVFLEDSLVHDAGEGIDLAAVEI